MNRTRRLLITFLLLTISISMLIWGYWPNVRVTLVRLVSSSEMQLPPAP